jgi:hypothetical protein
MSLPDLVLWILVFPLAMLPGLAAAMLTYVLARPRVRDDGGAVGLQRDLLVESWRLAAIVAAVPACILAMELVLWGHFFNTRVSVAYTGAAQWLGLVFLALSPVPLVAAAIRRQPVLGRPARQAAGLLALGLILFPLGWWLRDQTWDRLRLRAVASDQALREVLVLKGYRFITDAEVRGVLDQALPNTARVLDLVRSAAAPGSPPLDGAVTTYLAQRLDDALLAADPAVTTEPGLAAVPAIWALTSNPERTLRAYALAVPELRSRARAGAVVDEQSLVLDGLSRGSPAVVAALLGAFEPRAGAGPLRSEIVQALVRRMDEPAPVGRLAQAILLRDASTEALRSLVPRLARADDPAWELVRADCPSRTPGFAALATDADPAVAAGARAVLAYVRQFCVTVRPQGQ